MTPLHSPHGAILHRWPGSPTEPTAVALLLHGGREEPSSAPVPPWWPPVLRMVALAPALRDSRTGPAVHLLRFRCQGWNGGDAPVADARWALTELRRQYPRTPIVPVGHSMGSRVAVAISCDRSVAGAVALAPWLPPEEPLPELAGRRLVLIHGDADRELPISGSRDWAQRASTTIREPTAGAVRHLAIPGGGHGMFAHHRLWHGLTLRALDWIVSAPPD